MLYLASTQDKFWQLHDLLLEGVPETKAGIPAMLEGVGIDSDLWDGRRYRQEVEAAKAAAESRGVTDVGLFINGREYQKYPGTLDAFLETIEVELDSVGGGN